MHLTALGIPIRIGQMGVMVLSTIYSIQTASYSVTRPFVTPLCWIQALVPSPKFIKFLALSFGHAFSIILTRVSFRILYAAARGIPLER